jgi:hypothetical protein
LPHAQHKRAVADIVALAATASVEQPDQKDIADPYLLARRSALVHERLLDSRARLSPRWLR